MRAAPLFFVLLFTSTRALAGSAQASVDRSVISVDDELNLTITVIGDGSTPVLPSALRADFDVSGTRQAHNMNILNGRMSSSTQYGYTLTPKRTGQLQISAIQVDVDGAHLATQPITVTVQSAQANPTVKANVYATADLTTHDPSRTTAFVGEQLIYSLKLFARIDAQCSAPSQPSFANATVLELGQNRPYLTHVGGEEVSVIEIRRAVFPTLPGPLEIPPAVFTCSIEQSGRGFFGRSTRKTVRSTSAQIVVQALPPAPPSFTGLVGTVSAEAHISTHDVRQGESTTLTITVRGNGDMARAKEPELSGAADFKVYPDKPRIENAVDTEIIGTRTFESVLVAQRAGDFTLKAPPIAYFNPQSRTYETVPLPPIAIHVTPSADAGALGYTPPNQTQTQGQNAPLGQMQTHGQNAPLGQTQTADSTQAPGPGQASSPGSQSQSQRSPSPGLPQGSSSGATSLPQRGAAD